MRFVHPQRHRVVAPLPQHAAVRRSCLRIAALLCAGMLATPGTAQSPRGREKRYPDVIAVKVQARGADTFDFDVTVSSPYDSAQRYADAFRVSGANGQVYGERMLLHDHAGEQPFTRDLYGVVIPFGVQKVRVQARDRRYGYGGAVVVVALPGR